ALPYFHFKPIQLITLLTTSIFLCILMNKLPQMWLCCFFSPQEIKEELCRRAHATKVVELFIEEEKNVIVTASIDGSVRLWHAMTGYYFGYFGQARKFELSDTSRLILPSDVSAFPAIIKEDSKRTEKKVKYPLILDRDKWYIIYALQVSSLLPFKFLKLLYFWISKNLLKKLNVNSFEQNTNPSRIINQIQSFCLGNGHLKLAGMLWIHSHTWVADSQIWHSETGVKVCSIAVLNCSSR
uniref:WD repeat domain 64 n=1 Tax=Ficedula albicollis TaxID=59894 RepID=A0A803W8W7_FICAL